MIRPQVLIRHARVEHADRVDTIALVTIPVYVTFGFDTCQIGEIDASSAAPVTTDVAALMEAAACVMRRLAAG